MAAFTLTIINHNKDFREKKIQMEKSEAGAGTENRKSGEVFECSKTQSESRSLS